jgi:hypothetical protein
MSLIRKPDIEVFRDSSTVTALRGAKTLVQEGGGGAMRTISNIWLSMMLVVFILTGLAAMVQARSALAVAVCIPILGTAVWGLFRLWRAPTRTGAVQLGGGSDGADISVPLPDHLRHLAAPSASAQGFHVKYWPRAFVNQATVLLLFGGMGLSVTLSKPGFLTLACLLLVARGLLLFSIFFRGGVCVTASKDRLSVRSLIGEGEMLWSDITNITTETFSRQEAWIPLTTGSRHHIVVSGYHRLGSGKLLIPYKLLGLDNAGVRDLVRRLLSQQELARGVTREISPAPAGFGHRRLPAEPESTNPTFDPDAIIARYMAHRDQLISEQAPVQRPAGGFGRKRVG